MQRSRRSDEQDGSLSFHPYGNLTTVVRGRQIHRPGTSQLPATRSGHLFGLCPDVAHDQIGRAHVCTPVTNAHLVCRLLLEKKKETKTTPTTDYMATLRTRPE